MGYCMIHNQSYSEQMGGYCPYCGQPEAPKTVTTAGTTPEWNETDKITEKKE